MCIKIVDLDVKRDWFGKKKPKTVVIFLFISLDFFVTKQEIKKNKNTQNRNLHHV